MLVNKTYVTLPTLFTAYRISFVIPFIALSLITALLVGVNINLIILKFKEIKLLSGIGGTASLGLFGGILGGACPGCLVGLFPAFIGLFGVSATLSNLPLFGLEVQIASAGFLILSMFLLTKDVTCKIDLKK